MGSSYVLLILLATVCSLLPMARAPFPGLDAAKSLTSSSMDSLNIAQKYSFRNAYQIHIGCFRWCWPVITKVAREECKKNKKIRCEQKKNFGYKSFIVFHLSKFGMGKLASSVLGVPDAVVKAGIQAGTATLSAVGTGTVAVVGGVATGTVAAANGVTSGVKAATGVVGTGAAAVANGVSTSTEAVANGAKAATGMVGTGAKKMSAGMATGASALSGGLNNGAAKLGGKIPSFGRSPSFSLPG